MKPFGFLKLPSHRGYRADIDGLRAFAVLSVVIFHAFPGYLPGGFVGVDVFFVISGFLITSIIFTKLEAGNFSLAEFWKRRIQRIFPALIVMMSVILVSGSFILLPDEFRMLGKHVMAGSLFSSNLLLISENGYFDTLSDYKPLLHLWSLGVEEQFYLLWPIALAAVFRISGKARFRTIFIFTLAVLLASFSLNLFLVETHPSATFYSPLTRFWELLLGAILALAQIRFGRLGIDRYRFLPGLLSFLGLAAISTAVFTLNKDSVFPGWRALLPALGTVAIIAAGTRPMPNRWILSHPLAVYVGLISYPLYLWHWPLLSFLKLTFGQAPIMFRLAAIVLSLVLSVLTFEVIERRWKRGAAGTSGSVKLIFAMVVVAMIGGITSVHGPKAMASPSASAPSSLIHEKIDWTWWTNPLCLEKYPWSKEGGWWFCMVNSSAPASLLLLGNSHANHLYPGIIAQKEFRNRSILSIGTCDPTDGLFSLDKNAGENPCVGDRAFRQFEFINKIIVNDTSLKYAVLSSTWLSFDSSGQEINYFSRRPAQPSFESAFMEERALTQKEKYFNGIDRRIRFLESRNIQVILFLGTPLLPYELRNCIDRPFKGATQTCVIDKSIQLEAQKEFRDGVERLKIKHNTLKVFDPLEILCPDSTCEIKKGDDFLMRDKDHLSLEGSTRVGKAFAVWAGKNLPELVK